MNELAIWYFGFVWVLVMLYVVIGLFVHTTWILPALRKVHGEAELPFLPHAQLKQIDEYRQILDDAGERPWFYFYVRHNRLICGAMVLLMFSCFVLTAA